MEVRTQGSYEIAGREVVAEGADMRVQVLTLAPGQSIPWHLHTEITDSFVCLEGETVVETKKTGKTVTLAPGQRYAVPPNTPHKVYGSAGTGCQFLIIQGVGHYDFVPV